ncbi:MAG TPA: HEAT repeat domain-containing protein [Tepidisphaeraceae bacterium]|jgi:glucose/arabinose dehydrogenase/mono/diheme cytochrome c family protein|nr:HEAT repeat domain-containing protein [Tepidisphaeraceae bacterium]
MKRSSAAVAMTVIGLACSITLAKNAKNDSPAGAAILPVPHPVPLLSPEDEAKTFNLPPGFHAEVVACEPMIQHPVQIEFDPDGRLWVVEMRGYMPDIDGTGEDKPVGRISVLEDTNGDGRMDKATVFLDNLVLPRAMGLVEGGALVAVPPKVFFCRDRDGDGKADEKVEVTADYGLGGNPEHQPNGLMMGLDNWIWNADYSKRFRYAGGKWIQDVVPDLGQWGISQDDYGRLFHNTNSDQLRAALIPPQYANRNPYYRSGGANVQLAKDQTVWPSHDTAENRGYSKNFLRPDGTLREFTAACAPVVYRGDLFPKGFEGNVFLCEPSANVVRRNVLTEANGMVSAQNPYEQKEFIASTYERFRPVNLANGPDGALYVVDMHHGLIQHTVFVTSYASAQYLGRELNKYLNTGRIFRIVPDGAKPGMKPHLSTASVDELIGDLSNANGWWRDTAQRLLVEKNEKGAVAPLKKLATSGDNALGRLHALWTLEGMGKLDEPTLTAELGDHDAKVRSAAIRLCEPMLASKKRDEMLPRILALTGDKDPDVRLQFVLTVSEVGTPGSDEALAKVLADGSANGLVRDAAITGLHGRELEFLDFILSRPEWEKHSDGQAALIGALAQCVILQGNPKRVSGLMDLAAASGEWKTTAILDGFPAVDKRKGIAHRGVLMTAEPPAIAKLTGMTKDQKARIMAIVHWPGEKGYVPPPPVKPLTAEEQARFNAGVGIYTMLCGQCHKPDGLGKEGLAPPLLDSEWALGSENRMIHIVLGGLHGPITVEGRVYNLDMPSWRMLDDEKIADALTYVRRAWNHTASPIDPAAVKKVREEIGTRTDPWSERELLLIK